MKVLSLLFQGLFCYGILRLPMVCYQVYYSHIGNNQQHMDMINSLANIGTAAIGLFWFLAQLFSWLAG